MLCSTPVTRLKHFSFGCNQKHLQHQQMLRQDSATPSRGCTMLRTREPRQQKTPKQGFPPPCSVWTGYTNRRKAGRVPPARLPPCSCITRSNLALNVSLKLRTQIGDAVIKKPFVIYSTPAAEVRCTIGIPVSAQPLGNSRLCSASGCPRAIPGEEGDKRSKQGFFLACGSLITCSLDVYSERQGAWILSSIFLSKCEKLCLTPYFQTSPLLWQCNVSGKRRQGSTPVTDISNKFYRKSASLGDGWGCKQPWDGWERLGRCRGCQPSSSVPLPGSAPAPSSVPPPFNAAHSLPGNPTLAGRAHQDGVKPP